MSEPNAAAVDESPRVPVTQADDWDDSSSVAPPAEIVAAERAAHRATVEVPAPTIPEGHKEPDAPSLDPEKRQTPRHRSQKQQATSEDVPRIKELTKSLRSIESENAAIKAELAALKAPKSAPVEPVAPAAPQPFTETEPDLQVFMKAQEDGKTPDGYRDYVRAFTKWSDSRDGHAQRSAQAEQQSKAFTDGMLREYQTRTNEFVKAHPDFNDLILKQPRATDVFTRVIMTVANGPELAYAAAQRPDLWSEAQLLSSDKPVTRENVADLQRWLETRVLAAPTRSAAAKAPKPTPTPLNLVRTQAESVRADSPGGDTGSLEDHISQFHVAGRGRRR